MELPEEIPLSEISGQVFDYEDLLIMLHDIERLRKKTGWKVASTDTDQQCVFLVGEELQIVYFRFPLQLMKRVDWPRSFLGIDKIRNAFSRRSERQLLVKAFNDIPQDIERGEARSSWQRLMDNDIF